MLKVTLAVLILLMQQKLGSLQGQGTCLANCGSWKHDSSKQVMAVLWEHPWLPQRLSEAAAHQVPIKQLTQHTLAVARSQMSLFFLMKSDNSEVVVLLLYQGLGGTCISLFSVMWGFLFC